jgi:hypothetical protein
VLRTALVTLIISVASATMASADDVTWLDGCWRLDDSRGQITEIWNAPASASAAFGSSVTRRADTIVSWEQMRVESTRPIDTAFIAMPQGQTPTRFTFVPSVPVADSTDFRGELTFENRAHDFPQRIVYRGYADRLIATLSGPAHGSEVFEYRRIDCTTAMAP